VTVLTAAEVEDLKLLIADAATMEAFKTSDWGTWGYDTEGETAINNVWNLVDTYENAYNELLDVSADLIAANATIAARDATIVSLNATIASLNATILAKDAVIANKDTEITTLQSEKTVLEGDLATAEQTITTLDAELYETKLIAYGDPRVQQQYPARRSVTAINDTRIQADGSQFWGPLET
jgi:hypothetical protein